MPKVTEPTVHVHARQSPAGDTAPTTGMMKSSTTAATTLLNAAPITTAIASARTFSLIRKALKSRSMGLRIVDCGLTASCEERLEGVLVRRHSNPTTRYCASLHFPIGAFGAGRSRAGKRLPGPPVAATVGCPPRAQDLTKEEDSPVR